MESINIESIELDLQRIFNKQRVAFCKSPILTLRQRIASLNRLHHLLLENKENFVRTVSHDFGHRSHHETLLEIFSVLEEIRYAKRNLKNWMREKKRKIPFWYKFAYARIIPQPLGVVGIIAPWNGPINLTLSPLVGALAAGNRVMIKASELIPQTALLLKKVTERYFSEEEVAIITGDSHVGRKFTKLAFDHLLFTGSTHVGRAVMHAASYHLTPVTLELGGKSPVIIGKDVNLEQAVRKIILLKLLNAGQVCLAPDYVFLPKGKEEKFLAICKKTIAKYYPDILTNPNYTHIINSAHVERIQGYLDDAKANGALIIPLADENEIRCQNKLIPFAVLNVKPHMRMMQEEIFGPLLPIMTYEDVHEAIHYINERNKPLGLYYFGRNKREASYVIKNTFSGGACINDIGLHFCLPNLPFGGVGASGMGHYHGEHGFNTFSKLKPVLYQRRLNFIPLLYPPYGKIINFIAKIMLR